MSRLKKSLKGVVRQALAMVLASAMILSGMPVSAMEFSEEKSSVEVSGNAFFEETAETSEIEQRSSETEETENKNTASETEEAENKNRMPESESADKNESTTIMEENLITTTESENDGTEAEAVQIEENTMDLESETAVNRSVNTLSEGKNNTLAKYNLEGYAASYQVTGGGLLTTDDGNYHIANTEKEFLDALASAGNETATVIELTKDMELGNKELQEQGIYIQGNYSPSLHPTLQKTGVSKLSLKGRNLTIFSKNGSAIKHCGIEINGASNLIIRNIVFDELWEWDEATKGEYDLNDWDYITMQKSDGIWIDHCTFYKAYDGVVDIKNPSNTSNVTVSWCRFLPGSKDNIFFDEMMDYLDAHKNEMPYYKSFLDEGLTKEQIRQYAYGQKKTSLLGQNDSATNAKGIQLTLANNYYLDSMERLPRLRYGTVHEYNCVLDSQDLYDWRESSALLKSKITSNGALSTCDGHMLLENCYIKGIENPLVSGNANSRPGYINAVNSRYYIGETDKTDELMPKNNNYDSYTGSREVLVTDPDEFRNALPYSDYIKYPAESLNDDIVPYTGAGKITMTTVQWERTKYNEEEGGNTEESSSVEISSVETSETDESGSVPQEGLYIVGLQEAYDYTGAKIIPDIEVWDYDIPGGRLLALGTDYTVAYKNNINPGTNTAEVIVKGKGNYSGKDITKRFSILKITDGAENLADLKGAKIDKIDSVVYKGDAWYPDFTLKLKDGSSITYTQNTDTSDGGELYRRTDNKQMNIKVAVSNNINKGTATIFVTGAPDAKSNKAASIRKTFKITAADISTASVTATKATYAVSGAVPSSVIVKYGEGEKERILKAGKDYTIKYAQNKSAGEGTVTIIGKGNYTKKCAPVPYTIEKLDMSTLEVDAVTAFIGGKPQKIKAMINDGKGSMLKAEQYQLSVYKDKDGNVPYTADRFEVEGETIYVAATAKEGFKDLTGSTPTAEFKVGIDISKATIVSATTGKTVTKIYTGNAIELTGAELRVTLKVKGEQQPRTLIVDQDYKIATHFNNINKGSATVVIQGINSYGGTKAVKFKIAQKPVENLKKWEEMANALKDIMNRLTNS